MNQGNIWAVNNLNIFDFFTVLTTKLNLLDTSKYIVGIEAGTEIMQGSGSFKHTYTLNVS